MAPRNVALHIVYGIPCVGKSTAAVELAHHRSIRTVIHTDYIREVQRVFVSPKEAPALAKVTHTAWELHGCPTRRNIEAGFRDHLNDVAVGIRAVARKVVGDGFDAVIEGAHFHSDIIEELRTANGNAEVRATLLIVRTAEELQRRVNDKERRRASGSARKPWQENIPVMLAIQDFLIADARTHGIRVATADEWRRSWTTVNAYWTSTT
jgi:2-phosphoglycerate kinase